MTTLSYGNFSVEAESLPAVSLERILRLGYSTALKNSIAGIGKKLKDEGKSDAEVDAALQTILAAKHAKILAGDWTAERGAGTAAVSPLDREIAKVARESITAALHAKGITLPKEGRAEKIAALVEKFTPTQGASWRAEAEKRLAAKATVALDLDDLSDLLGTSEAGAEEDPEA